MAEKLTCSTCGKVYTKQNFYDKHIIKCNENAKEKEAKKVETKEKLQEKVKEVQVKAQEILVPESGLNSFWKSFWATIEGISTQLGLVIDELHDIKEAVQIDKNTKKVISAQIDSTTKLLNKAMEMSKPQPVLTMGTVISSGDIKPGSKIEAIQESTPEIVEEFEAFPDSEEIINETIPDEVIEEVKETNTVNAKNLHTEFDEDKNIQIQASIKGATEKALLLKFNGDKESWIPKSCVHNEYSDEKNLQQTFIIDKWVLKKNGLIE